MDNNDRSDRFVESGDTVLPVGYLGKDGKIHKELAPEDRVDVSQFYRKTENPDASAEE